jgi:hypothetical protein
LRQHKTQVCLETDGTWADIITNPALAFDEHLAAADDASLFEHRVKVAAPKTLLLLLEESDEPKHARDRELLEHLLTK